LDNTAQIFQIISDLDSINQYNFFVSSSIQKIDLTDSSVLSSPYLFFVNKYGIMEINLGLRFNNNNILLSHLYENKFQEVETLFLLNAFLF